ncbi:MAG: hypothetical protein NC489_08470 [Ruminococcus flavefaciens]|nr:hypothetical protein [Ruminococcus flavefaciens]
MKGLTTMGVFLGDVYYGVIEDYPFDDVKKRGPDALKKAVAYRYERRIQVGDEILLESLMLPYRGLVPSGKKRWELSIGIWLKKVNHSTYREVIIRPQTEKEAQDYATGKEEDVIVAILENEYAPTQFADAQLNPADIGTDVYLPPIHAEDDPLNMLLKLGIRLKGASFAPYGKRLEALAVDRNGSGEKANIRNNVRRALFVNFALSPTKFCQYSDNWQFEPAFILKDRSDAMHPMHLPEGKMLVVYPGGIPFDIDQKNLINAADLIAEAVTESSKEIEAAEAHKKKKNTEDKNDVEG